MKEREPQTQFPHLACHMWSAITGLQYAKYKPKYRGAYWEHLWKYHSSVHKYHHMCPLCYSKWSQAISEISGQFQTDLHQLFIGMEIYCHTYSIHYCSLFSGVDFNNCPFFFFPGYSCFSLWREILLVHNCKQKTASDYFIGCKLLNITGVGGGWAWLRMK